MKLTKIISLILAAAILSIGLATTSAAEGSYYEEQLKKYEAMQNKTISVDLNHDMLYALKSEKFYYREVLGLSYDGEFQISGWKCINNPSSHFTLPGNCVMFGYSFDILAGTDWPYSGCFWGWDKRETLVDCISISLSGFVRTAMIFIYVDGSLVFVDHNCDSHSEWRPC